MGLDAVIFCNCIETKKLKMPHPFPRLLYISRDGSPEIRSEDSSKIAQHDEWMALPPCEHEDMMIDGCSLGNAGAIGSMYDALATAHRPPLPKLPILLNKVIYSGTHCGDFLTLAQVRKLDAELKQLRKVKLKELGISKDDATLFATIIKQLERLVRTSLKVGKPIAF